MPDKGGRLYDFGSAFLHLNAGNETMYLNPRHKPATYVVFSLLYEFCVVCMFYKRVVCVFYFSCCIFRVA